MIQKLLARLLLPKPHFHGGLHITPPRHKTMSTGVPSRKAALSDEYYISLNQRDGSAYIPRVAVGEHVLRGQLLAQPANNQDAPVHAPTSGTIRAIEPRPDMHPSNRPVPHLILQSDGQDQAVPPLPPLDAEQESADTLRNRITDCGIVGLGGAGFPTARKLGHPANTLVINAAECEPYITCDDLQIRENPADIIRGAQITARILGAEHIHFGIEDDKPQAIAALEQAAADIADPRITISTVPTRYPSGNARQLFELLLGVRVPADKHASDYGLICHNSGTMKAVYDAVARGLPLTERYTTISGEGINQPQVLRIRIGTPVRDLIKQAGGENGNNRYIIGGPMMGYEIASTDTALQKTGNSLLLLPAAEPAKENPCIRCARCADACPMELLPQQLLWYSRNNEHARLKQYRLHDCIECGICAAVCPSAIPLVQYYRHSKGEIRLTEEKNHHAERARARHEARTARLEREAAERRTQMEARRTKLQQPAAANAPPATTNNTQTVAPPDTSRSAAAIPAADSQKAAAIEAAKARAAARKTARLNPPNGQPSEPAATGGKPPPYQHAADSQKAAVIEAAKARAAARKTARLTAQKQTGPALPVAAAQHLPPQAGGEKEALPNAGSETAVATNAEQAEHPKTIPSPNRGRRTGQGKTNQESPISEPPTTEQNRKTAAIEAAKARAAARKAARLAGKNKQLLEPARKEIPAGQPPMLDIAAVVPSDTANKALTTTGPAAMNHNEDPDKAARDAKLAAARAKTEARRIAHAKLKQHMRDTAVPIRPQPDDKK